MVDPKDITLSIGRNFYNYKWMKSKSKQPRQVLVKYVAYVYWFDLESYDLIFNKEATNE